MGVIGLSAKKVGLSVKGLVGVEVTIEIGPLNSGDAVIGWPGVGFRVWTVGVVGIEL